MITSQKLPVVILEQMAFVFGNNLKIKPDIAEFNFAKMPLILMLLVNLVVLNFLLRKIALLPDQPA